MRVWRCGSGSGNAGMHWQGMDPADRLVVMEMGEMEFQTAVDNAENGVTRQKNVKKGKENNHFIKRYLEAFVKSPITIPPAVIIQNQIICLPYPPFFNFLNEVIRSL
jgi:hypothetical protein